MMNKWFLSLIVLSFGASVLAQTPAQVNPFNYYKSDSILQTNLDFKSKKMPNLLFNVQSVNLKNDLSRSEEHKLSGQYTTKVLGGNAGLKYSNNKDFLTQNIKEDVALSYALSGSYAKLSLTVNNSKNQTLFGQSKNNTQLLLSGTISIP